MMNKVVTIPDSQRLSYRLMKSEDSELLFDLDQDPEVMRYINSGIPTTMEEVKNFYLPRFERFTDPRKGSGIWMVFSNVDSIFMGWILVRPYRFGSDLCEQDNLELGWRFKRKYWGRGIATEAAQSVKNVLQNLPGIRKFSAIADPANTGSLAVMKKLGMHFVDFRIHQQPNDSVEVAYYEMKNPACRK